MNKRLQRTIGGELCEVEICGANMMRFRVSGFYDGGPTDIAERVAKAGIPMELDMCPDGCFMVTAIKLISADTPDGDLPDMMDELLNAMEEALGLTEAPYDENLSSSSWNAGSDDPRWDYLLTAKERAIIAGLERADA